MSQDDIMIYHDYIRGPCLPVAFGGAVLDSSPVFKDLFLAGWWRTVLQFHLGEDNVC